jgi:hypothetical protein
MSKYFTKCPLWFAKSTLKLFSGQKLPFLFWAYCHELQVYVDFLKP